MTTDFNMMLTISSGLHKELAKSSKEHNDTLNGEVIRILNNFFYGEKKIQDVISVTHETVGETQSVTILVPLKERVINILNAPLLRDKD